MSLRACPLRGGYERAAAIVDACGAGLSPEKRAAVMGGKLSTMFPGGWY